MTLELFTLLIDIQIVRKYFYMELKLSLFVVEADTATTALLTLIATERNDLAPEKRTA
jgi:hypothetical protein